MVPHSMRHEVFWPSATHEGRGFVGLDQGLAENPDCRVHRARRYLPDLQQRPVGELPEASSQVISEKAREFSIASQKELYILG